MSNEAYARSHRAMNETCGTVDDICSNAEPAADFSSIAHTLRQVYSDIEDAICALSGETDEIENCDGSYDNVSERMKAEVTFPFRDALTGAFEELIEAEDKLTAEQDRTHDLECDLYNERKAGRVARFAIRSLLTMRRMRAA